MRLDYREVEGRFGHIDAEFVGSSVALPDGEARYSVRLYPWWEHPGYIAAREQGKRWRFHYGEEAKRVVTVMARRRSVSSP